MTNTLVTIVTHNGRDVLSDCITSLQNSLYANDIDILVVDNKTDDIPSLDVLDEIRKKSFAEVLVNEGNGYDSGGYQFAINKYLSEYDLFFFGHDDLLFNTYWLSDMKDKMMLRDVGAVALATFKNCWDTKEQVDYVFNILKMPYRLLPGICGPFFLTDRIILQEIIKKGWMNFVVTTKRESQAMERGWGHMISSLGYRIEPLLSHDHPHPLTYDYCLKNNSPIIHRLYSKERK